MRRLDYAGKPVFASCLSVLLYLGCGVQQTGLESRPLLVETDTRQSKESASPALGSQGESSAVRVDETPPIVAFETVQDFPQGLAIFDSVFWEPDDTKSLRDLIRSNPKFRGSRVLEIGTGSGLISLCCLQAGAANVVATDINPRAVLNAEFNARELGLADRFEVRLVPRRSPEAWTVVGTNERFDFIISNPPWEDARPAAVDQFALYDPGFKLLDSLVRGCRDRLNPGGRMLLAYGCVTAIRRIQERAKESGLECRILDDRSLEGLPEVFLPGMLIEVSVPRDSEPNDR